MPCVRVPFHRVRKSKFLARRDPESPHFFISSAMSVLQGRISPAQEARLC